MTSRRELLKIGLTASVSLALAPFGQLSNAFAARALPYKAIFDERFPASVAFARAWQRHDVPVHGIRGDVTALWYHDLHFAWKNAPVEIAGMTTKESLFCLETLARDAGHRVTACQTLESGLVSWSIGPRRSASKG